MKGTYNSIKIKKTQVVECILIFILFLFIRNMCLLFPLLVFIRTRLLSFASAYTFDTPAGVSIINYKKVLQINVFCLCHALTFYTTIRWDGNQQN